MANKTFQGRIVQKHDTKANWDKAINFIPLKGEIIIYDDLNKIKIGDGTTKINDLKFSLANSDLFICKVTASGTNYTCDKTIREMMDAQSAGKIVVAIYGTITYSLYAMTQAFVRFVAISGNVVSELNVRPDGTTLISSSKLQESALITDLEANKDNNTSYPSAKAVYDAIPHPDNKTDTQTQSVSMDNNGKLWTTPTATTIVTWAEDGT